jgi:hypothetical protein
MKRISRMIMASMVVLSLAGPLMAPAFAAAPPTTQAECEKAGMRWKEKASKCRSMPGRSLSTAQKIVGLLGLMCALILLFQIWTGRLERAD